MDAKQRKAFDAVTTKIQKDFGSEALIDMSAGPKPVDVISTGVLPLDIVLGAGGLPKGRLIEIFGPESSGKTTLAYHTMAQVQRENGVAAFIDVEHAMDPVYAAGIGLDLKDLLISQPDSAEEALNIVETMAESGVVDLIVVDSVAALTPQVELEGKMGDQTVGLLARLMSQACRKLRGTCNRNQTTIIFINQIREKIGVSFGSPETQPGGRALKFYSSQRIDIRRIGSSKSGTEVVANNVKVKVVKNKVAPPFTQVEFQIVFGKGIDSSSWMMNQCLDNDLDIVTKSGSFYKIDGEQVQGEANAVQMLDDNPEMRAKVEKVVRDFLLPEPEELNAELEELDPAEEAEVQKEPALV